MTENSADLPNIIENTFKYEYRLCNWLSMQQNMQAHSYITTSV